MKKKNLFPRKVGINIINNNRFYFSEVRRTFFTRKLYQYCSSAPEDNKWNEPFIWKEFKDGSCS